MPALPRIITVDASGMIAQMVRGAIDLMDRFVVHVDVPSGSDAIEEVRRGGCLLVLTAWELGNGMPGWELAAKVRQVAEDTNVVILADADDPEMDEETLADSPFIYLQRPLDPLQFMRIFSAAINGDDPREAMQTVSTADAYLGPIPSINLEKATQILDALQIDLNSLAILLAARDGAVLLERGTLGHVDRHRVTALLRPSLFTTIQLKDVVGGNTATIQFFDGDEYDIFAISIGLHHFLTIVFDGQLGSRQFGAVNRFGRRAAEDLIALLGAEAWLILPPELGIRQPVRRRPRRRVEVTEPIELAPADIGDIIDEATISPAEEPVPMIQLEPIADLDIDALFDMAEVSSTLFDDMDALEVLARDEGRRGTITDEEARRLGLIK